MPEHDRAADTSRAPDERIDPRRSRRSICMTNEIDVAPPLSDHDRACRVRRHGAVHGVHRAQRTHALVARPVSVVAAIAPRRRRCRFPIKNSHAKYQRGLPVSRLRHTPGTTSAPHRTFRRRNVDGLPSRACPARNPQETGFLHRMDVTRIDTVACNRFSCCLAIANRAIGWPIQQSGRVCARNNGDAARPVPCGLLAFAWNGHATVLQTQTTTHEDIPCNSNPIRRAARFMKPANSRN
ncbi:hypothetical protein [Burkholderia pyrrocinia]|uniref:hypothetical protein n=1 Tax=Burkholderia pyrrocinia TaxID=60550 RepID=UPI00158A5C72|nr:hypothetical protein [Burkholderia pyrrocinia]